MANRAFFQMLASLVERLTYLQGDFTVGSSGAVSDVNGSGIDDVVHVDTGVYQVKLSDSYNRLLDFQCSAEEPVGTPATIASGLTSGLAYSITTVGDASLADWHSVGLPVGVVPAVGVSFVATSTGSGNATTARVAPVAGTSTADAQVYNLFGNPDLTVNCSVPGNAGAAKQAGYFLFVVRSGVGVVTDPPSGAKLKLSMHLRNSSVKGKGE